MKRKDFIKAAGACLACAGGVFAAGREAESEPGQTEAGRRAGEHEERFKQA